MREHKKRDEKQPLAAGVMKKVPMNSVDCTLFTGYKPCEPGKVCPCDDTKPFGHRILIVNLDFIGDVLMTTALLPAIKRKYPESTVQWITRKEALPVLEQNPYLHRIWIWDDESRLILERMRFETVLNADKNQNSSAFTLTVDAGEKLGFGLNENGAVIPLNPEAGYNYRMGLDDRLKFKENTRSGLDILAETWKLDYQEEEYVLQLTEQEKAFTKSYRKQIGAGPNDCVIGLNTGCSALYPLKKMTVDQHIELIRLLEERLPGVRILLLGGRSETERNALINQGAGGRAVETPTTEGLRRGILYENACDIVVTGDTLGMHIAIGLKKTVVAWFGLSCAAEIELFGRGRKIISELECAPCWKRSCDDPVCLKTLDMTAMADTVKTLHAYLPSKQVKV